MIDWYQLDRLVMFGMGFVYAVIIFFFFPELWKDIKDGFQILFNKEENSPADTGERNKKIIKLPPL